MQKSQLALAFKMTDKERIQKTFFLRMCTPLIFFFIMMLVQSKHMRGHINVMIVIKISMVIGVLVAVFYFILCNW